MHRILKSSAIDVGKKMLVFGTQIFSKDKKPCQQIILEWGYLYTTMFENGSQKDFNV